MTDIVLNRRDASTGKLVSMEQSTAESILQRLVDAKTRRVSLHASWQEAPGYSSWLLKELHDGRVLVTACVDLPGDIAAVDRLVTEPVVKELCLFKEKTGHSGESLDTVKGLHFFLPVDQVSPDGALYRKLIEGLPPQKKITLGINWRNRLSGPLPIDEDDYQAWSETVLSLVEMLSAKRIVSNFGCGLRQCMFSGEQLGTLPARLVSWPIASCHHSCFYDVDGTLTPCMRLEVPGHLRFNHETDIKRAEAAFSEWLGPFSGHCMEAEELECRSLKTGGCATGCPQHSMDEWKSF